MGARLEPPPWSAVGGLLEDSAVLYAVLFAVAVAVSFTVRSTALRFFRDLLFRWKATASFWLFLVHVTAAAVRHAFVLALARIFFSTLVCVVYVYVTYLGQIPFYIRAFQLLLGVLFLFRFVLSIFCAHNPIAFMVHVETLMEALSIASLIYARGDVWLHFSFLQAIVVLSRYFQVEPVLEAMMVRKTSPFRRQLARLTLEFIVFIYVFACGLQLFEVLGDPTESLTATTFELTLANSLYFTVVTIFTVGYGDFVPYTLLGRLWIIFIIVFGAYLVSRKIGQVIDVVSGLRRGMGAFVKDDDVDHCVLCGNVKWEYLKTFVQEFYADVGNQNTKVVVMCGQPNWTEELWNSFFTSDTEFKDNVVYLEGACMARDDLLRAQVETALAVFVLNNQHDPQPYLEDSETLKRILSVRAFAPNLPIYSMCALRDSMLQITVALEHDDSLTAASAMKAPRAGTAARSGSFRAAAVFSRSGGTDSGAFDGFGSSLYGSANADAGDRFTGVAGDGSARGKASGARVGIQSAFSVDFSEEEDDDDFMVVDYDGLSDLKSDAICMQEVEMSLLAENVFCNGLSTLLSNLVLNVLPQTKPTDRPWMVEYKIGAECRMAYVKLPMELHGKRFSEIALSLYDYGILLLATKRFSDVKWRTITPDTVIHLNTIGLVVTFHSANFIDTVMQHAAQFLLQRDLDSGNSSELESSSRGVPSEDDPDFGEDLMTGSGDVDAAASEAAAAAEDAREMSHGMGHQGDPLTQDIVLDDDDLLAMSPPDFRAKNVGVTGLTAEGARLSDAELGEDSHQAGSGQLDALGHESPTFSASPEIFTTGAQLPPRSASAADLSKQCRQSPDELDALADVLVEESMNALSDSPPEGNDPAISPLASTPVCSGQNRAARSSSSGPRVLSDVGEGSRLDDRVNSDRPVREGSRVSFPAVLSKPKRRHSAYGAARFGIRGSSDTAGREAKGRSGIGKNVAKNDTDPSPPKDMERVFFGDAPLPVRLKGHIVVCVIGQMGLVNLKHFLQRVWMRRRGFKRETPVVAICPKITDAVEDDIAFFSSNKFFVVQGNSLNIATLRRAQYDRARAIVVLACEDKNDVDHMDAKAIFTVMTLDYMLGERSNTFVCTMIDAEESMKLLRAPAHARRRGVNLGRVGDDFSFGRSPGPGRSQSSLGASHSFTSPMLPPGANLSGASASMPVPVPNSPLLRLPESWAAEAFPRQKVPDTDASLEVGRGDWRRANTSYSLGANSLSSFMDGPGPAVPQSPAYVGSLTNQWSNRSAALHQIVTGESKLSPLQTASRFRTSRTVSFLGVVGDSFARAVRAERTTLSASLGGGASSATNFIYPSASFGAGIPSLSSVFPGAAAGAPGMLPGLDADALLANMPGVAGNGELSQDAGRKRNRGELFERQRYASGEMMISSVYVALLIREFAMPGLMSVVRKIFGVGVGKNPRSKKCWIRTMKVPSSWVESGLDCERTYRELFKTLLSLNCIPLGLYRSGQANVRVQLAMDRPAGNSERGSETEPLLSDVEEIGPRNQSYTCPTTGHTANFEQIPGGENVLPYVYTNPEPYTLISEHDAVYILAHPLLKIPDVWGT
jgi:voltage-gated potassium channel Kch